MVQTEWKDTETKYKLFAVQETPPNSLQEETVSFLFSVCCLTTRKLRSILLPSIEGDVCKLFICPSLSVSDNCQINISVFGGRVMIIYRRFSSDRQVTLGRIPLSSNSTVEEAVAVVAKETVVLTISTRGYANNWKGGHHHRYCLLCHAWKWQKEKRKKMLRDSCVCPLCTNSRGNCLINCECLNTSSSSSTLRLNKSLIPTD